MRKRSLVDRGAGGGKGEYAKPGSELQHSTRAKRTEAQREADLALIAKLLIRENLTRAEIAGKLSEERPYSLTAGAVEYDVKELYKRWRDAYLDDIDVLKGRELRRVDELESAYWDSYARSLRGTNEFTDDTTEFDSDIDENSDIVSENSQIEGKIEEVEGKRKRTKRHVSRKFTTERDGEVRFLNGIQWCINKRCEILGLNAPLKAEMTFDWRKEAERDGFNPMVVYNELVQKFTKDNMFIDGETKELTDNV